MVSYTLTTMLTSTAHETSPPITQCKRVFCLLRKELSRKVLEDVVLNAYREMEMAKEKGTRDGRGHALLLPNPVAGAMGVEEEQAVADASGANGVKAREAGITHNSNSSSISRGGISSTTTSTREEAVEVVVGALGGTHSSGALRAGAQRQGRLWKACRRSYTNRLG